MRREKIGPKSGKVLERLVKEDLSSLRFMHGREMRVGAVPVYVTRCGYTGEDGFEVRKIVFGCIEYSRE